MFYQFRCQKHGNFEIQQPITAEHRATCSKCGADCQRIYSTFQWVWAGTRFREDGSKRQESDYAQVMRG